MKRMLINATQQEELRVALVDGQRLYDLDIEVPGKEQKKANIYKGRISRVEPSLEAAFIDYGAERHGFLPLKEISPTYFTDPSKTRGNIKELLKEGQEVIVQIEKEERGQKGAALTTYISLAGCYVVLMPNNPRAGGISRRIEGDDRSELREALHALDLPDGMGIIIRTAGVGRSEEELKWDLGVLLTQWNAITEAAAKRPAPFLIYAESDVIIRSIRDYLKADIGEIIVDTQDAYNRIRQHIELVRPDFVSKVKLYKDDIPLFNRYQVESQIESAYQREVRLPSGGSIVIDRTEAMVCIDVNSSKATKGGDIEETALQTNIEAAQEVARQLRLRDLGGLVVIDFIDMTPAKNQRMLEDALRDAVEMDRARIQLGRLSKFGLMEMSRQRLRPALAESTTELCPRCNGVGHIRNVESMSLSVLRLIEEEAMKDSTSQVQALLPVEAATYLLNEKRKDISNIEKRHDVHVVVVPNPHIETPNYEVRRLRQQEVVETVSYSLAEQPVVEAAEITTPNKLRSEAPAVQYAQVAAPAPIAPAAPAPQPVKATAAPVAAVAKPGILRRIWDSLFGSGEPVKEEKGRGRNDRDRNKRRDGRPDNRGERRDGRDGRGPRRDGRQDGGRQEAGRQDAGRQDNRGEGRDQQRQARDQNREQQADTRRQQQPKAEGQRDGRQPREERQPRGERQPREERPAREPQQAREERAPREERQPREDRGPRQTRAERMAMRQQQTGDAPAAEVLATVAPVLAAEPITQPANNSVDSADVSVIDRENIEATEQRRDRGERGDRRRRLPRHLGGGRRRDREGGEADAAGELPVADAFTAPQIDETAVEVAIAETSNAQTMPPQVASVVAPIAAPVVVAAASSSPAETAPAAAVVVNVASSQPAKPEPVKAEISAPIVEIAPVVSAAPAAVSAPVSTPASSASAPAAKPAPVAPMASASVVSSQPTPVTAAPVAAAEAASDAARPRVVASAPAAKPKPVAPAPKPEVSEEEALKNVAALLASLIEPTQNQSTVLHRSSSSSSSPMAKPRATPATESTPPAPAQSSIERAAQQIDDQNNS